MYAAGTNCAGQHPLVHGPHRTALVLFVVIAAGCGSSDDVDEQQSCPGCLDASAFRDKDAGD